jgi:hypothetical protein
MADVAFRIARVLMTEIALDVAARRRLCRSTTSTDAPFFSLRRTGTGRFSFGCGPPSGGLARSTSSLIGACCPGSCAGAGTLTPAGAPVTATIPSFVCVLLLR